MKRRASHLFLLAAVLGVFAGCGGSSGPAASSETPGTDAVLGPFSTRAEGEPQAPVVSTGSGAVVTGQAGASFLNLSVNLSLAGLAKPLINEIVCGRAGELWAYKPDGSSARPLVDSSQGSFTGSVAVSADGRWIATPNAILSSDGKSMSYIPGGPSLCFSPDGSQVTFSSSGDLWTINADSTLKVNLTRNGALGATYPAWLPSGLIAARTPNSITYFKRSGEIAAQTPNLGGDPTELEASADGRKLVFRISNDLYMMPTDRYQASDLVRITNTPSLTEMEPSFSPDGKSIVYRLYENGELYTMPVSPIDASRIKNISNTPYVVETHPCWSKRTQRPNEWNDATNEVLIGSAGSLKAPSAAGFLYSMTNSKLGSVAAFDTVTTTLAARSEARITALTGLGSMGPIVFDISTTSLSPLSWVRYRNGYDPAVLVDVNPYKNNAGAIVTFDGSTGSLTSVAPYTLQKAAQAKPLVENGLVRIERSFLAVIENGVKKAGPASEAAFDAKTGRLVSTR